MLSFMSHNLTRVTPIQNNGRERQGIIILYWHYCIKLIIISMLIMHSLHCIPQSLRYDNITIYYDRFIVKLYCYVDFKLCLGFFVIIGRLLNIQGISKRMHRVAGLGGTKALSFT